MALVRWTETTWCTGPTCKVTKASSSIKNFRRSKWPTRQNTKVLRNGNKCTYITSTNRWASANNLLIPKSVNQSEFNQERRRWKKRRCKPRRGTEQNSNRMYSSTISSLLSTTKRASNYWWRKRVAIQSVSGRSVGSLQESSRDSKLQFPPRDINALQPLRHRSRARVERPKGWKPHSVGIPRR